uniref:Endo-1,4-beta-xylanase A n=1 Tax=uncultured bacterium contig00007 TaxID=1181499 RepID=A0A806KLE1_9BACT|nr:endo-1,4-beta-xylanase A precursor [uncultured bacterium contig00007]
MKRRHLTIIAIFTALAAFIFAACTEPDNPASFTVTFNSNHDGECDVIGAKPKTMTVAPGKTLGALPSPPYCVDHAFTGWTFNQDGTGGRFTANTAVTASITVYAQWTDDTLLYSIDLKVSGKEGSDSVSASPIYGHAGEFVTINYTLDKTKLNNRLAFSGALDDTIDASEGGVSDTIDYMINSSHAAGDNSIALFAVFTHTDLQLNTITFAQEIVNKTYGDAPFTNALNSGSGTGAVTYSSSDTTVASVNNSGLVTIFKTGHTTITAVKASDGTYAETSAFYTLNVSDPSQGGNPVDVARYSIVDFEADNIGKTYPVTKADNNGTAAAAVAADPANSGQKSLKVTTTPKSNSGYNLAAIVPITIPNPLQDYKEFSFRIRMVSPASFTNSVLVYAASAVNQFLDYGFGNEANSEYAQYASRLVGQTQSAAIGSTWTAYTITITNPGNDIKNLQDNIYLAIGIHTGDALEYMLDDIKFTLKDNVNPVAPPVTPPAGDLTPPSIGTGAISTGTYRNLFTEGGWKTSAQVSAKVNQIYNDLFNGTGGSSNPNEAGASKIYYEVGSDMAYIWDTGNNDVRSEGMSYGMMMCVQMDDKTRFDKLWRWARQYMYNDRTQNAGGAQRGYYAWQVGTNGNKKDSKPAPDGEFYFTTALLFAHARWGSASGQADVLNYAQRARELLYDMCRRDRSTDGYNGIDGYDQAALFRRPGDHRQNNSAANPMAVGNYMPVFSPSGGSANHSDPSYHLPAFFEIWALELEQDIRDNQLYGVWATLQELQDDAAFYRQAAETSRAYFKVATHALTGLGADYAEFNGTPTGSQNYFGYDAFRIALNIGVDYAWFAKDDWQITFADRIQGFFESKGVTSYKALWLIDGTQRNPAGDHSPGLVACNAAVSLAATNARARLFLEDFWNISMTKGQYRYYDGCLSMLGLLNVTGNFKAYLRSSTTAFINQ